MTHHQFLVPAVRHQLLPRLVRHELAAAGAAENVATGVADEEVEVFELEALTAERLFELLVGEDREQAYRDGAVCTGNN